MLQSFKPSYVSEGDKHAMQVAWSELLEVATCMRRQWPLTCTPCMGRRPVLPDPCSHDNVGSQAAQLHLTGAAAKACQLPSHREPAHASRS